MESTPDGKPASIRRHAPGAAGLLFRFRTWIILALCLLGFFSPWRRLFAAGPDVTLWLALSTWLSRAAKLGIELSTVIVTLVALACCSAGAAFRVWGTAYLGFGVVHADAMQAGHVVASGPYRYLRNPLYLGTLLLALGFSILMPPSGAVVFLVGLCLLQMALIRGEERFLSEKLGDAYREYRHRVPRLLPRLRVTLAGSKVRPQWLYAAFTEIWGLGFALCFAVLAWRYNAMILIKCLIICFGLSLILKALLPAGRRPA